MLINIKINYIMSFGGIINEQTLDRRVRKTRTQLRKCLSILLETKKIQNITVKELAQMADINRGTFYLHYKDVYDLMEHIQADLLNEFEDILTKIAPDTDNLVPFIEALFVFIYDNKDMAKIFRNSYVDEIKTINENMSSLIAELYFDGEVKDFQRDFDEEIFKISRFKDEMPELKRFYYTKILESITLEDKRFETLACYKNAQYKKYKSTNKFLRRYYR